MSAVDGILTSEVWPRLTVSVTRRDDAPAAPVRETLDDRDLVECCRAGDRDAFDVLVTRHQRAVYGVCYRFVGNHDDAADLAQEVFLRAYRALGKFKGASAFGTWLHRIAVNVSLNRVGARRPPMQPIEASKATAVQSSSPAETLLRGERAARVRAAVARLPRKQRATLILRVYRDLSHQEIAAVLGTSVGAVKANFFHALNNLRRMLGAG